MTLQYIVVGRHPTAQADVIEHQAGHQPFVVELQ